MKKVTLITTVAALAMILGLSQCKKPNMPIIGFDGKYATKDYSINFTTADDSGAKGSFEDATSVIRYKWSDTDKIYVYETSLAGNYDADHGHFCGVLDCHSETGSTVAVFSNPKLTLRTNSVQLRFVHYGSSVTVNTATGQASIAFDELDGELPTISGMVVAVCDKAFQYSGIYTDCKLELQFSLAKFNLSNFVKASGGSISGKYICSTANTINVSTNGEVSYSKTGTDASTTITNVTNTSTQYYVAIIPTTANSGNTVTVDFTMDNEYLGNRMIGNYSNDKYYSANSLHPNIGCFVTPVRSDGTLPGIFSICDKDGNEVKVQFSRGNVQFNNENTSSVTSDNWRFAKNQWDYIGTGNVVSNTLPATLPADWMDLFGWGCAHNTTVVSGRKSVPWAYTDTDGSNYGPVSGALNGWGATSTSYQYYDWGHNFGDFRTWFTMLPEQWRFLLGLKYSGSTIPNRGGNMYAKGSVCGVNGLIIFPDGWGNTISVPSYITVTNYNTESAEYSVNTFDAEKWAVLEALGAVFLPAAGTRRYESPNLQYSGGNEAVYYWTARTATTSNAYRFTMGSSSVSNFPEFAKCRGCAVRVVREAITDGTSSATPFNSGNW